MFKNSLIPIAVVAALTGCGSDDTSKLEGNSNGAIEIVGNDFIAGATLTTKLSDPDGIVDETVSYLWSTGATGNSYTITEADEDSVITASALYTDQAGFMQGVNASTTVILPTLNVTANIMKGPVSGANCELFAVDDNGAAVTPAHASATSGAAGAVVFSDVHFKGTGLVACNGGTYSDESTGETLDAPELRAVLNLVKGDSETPAPSYVVSPLTEMAVQAAGTNLNNFATEAAAINLRFGIRFDITEVAPTVVGVDALGADGAENADRYGSVLALISQLDNDDTTKDIATVIAGIREDLADGTFSDITLDALELAQTNLQTTSNVANDVKESLLDTIGAAAGYNNEPVTAIIEGMLTGTVNNTATDPLTGMVTVTDPNFEEDAIIIQTDVALDYGSFSITADGSWSYTVDVTNDTVANLELGNSVNDLVTITSIDGTIAEIAIRVAALTQVVKISDLGGDTGEIKFDVADLRQGKLTASFSKEVALGSDGNIKDAYITLYGSSGSSSESLIDLRIQGNQTDGNDNPIAPRFFVRNTDSSTYSGDMITAPFVEGQFYDVEITWDLDATEQITVSIDGEVIGGGAFSTAAVVDSDFVNLDQWFVDGIQSIQFRFGDNDRTIPFGSFFVDNIAVYSDTAGTVMVFEDDFESYTEGETLDGSTSLYKESVYSEVVVYDVGDGTEPTPASILDLTGRISGDEATSTGAVSVFDPDDGEAFIVESALMGMYGALDIFEDGSWTYTLDANNQTIAALVVGESEIDTFTIESFDGTTAELVITISGTVVVNTGANNVAVIRDTLGETVQGESNDGDTGELRYTLPEAQLTGKLTASFNKAANTTNINPQDTDTDNKDAYITLFNSQNSTSSGRAIADLRIRTSNFQLRDQDDLVISNAFTPDTWQDVEITWEAVDADTPPTITVSIDGVAVTTETITSGDAAIGGVTAIAFRLSDNDAALAPESTFKVDDIAIYSDTAGTALVFEDDFESYADGHDLDQDPYASATSEAVVETIAGNQASGPGVSGNKMAKITDTLGETVQGESNDGDTGELRYTLPEAQLTGKLTAAFNKAANTTNINPQDTDTDNKDAYITLFNSQNSTSSGRAIADLRIRTSNFQLRDQDDLVISNAFTPDTWQDVEITWEAVDADTPPKITVSIDGVAVTTETITSGDAAIGGVTAIAFRLSDNDAALAPESTFKVDDIAIYSDTAGTTLVFEDDFESYADGHDLDQDPYASATSEAVVAVED
ncbi:VCBS domain-containing protein [Paraglaciecola sp. L3A3]|uniref:VCBS domain-containing protein n=1 Tax=Paraglaciecola sp. L3A3 TaxID=2686358 RepID=UPI00131BB4E0|nr:VCBS domain-containing protein [Paraglaciecola sp. L3A3]